MMKIPTLGVLYETRRDEAWVRRVRRTRKLWIGVSAGLFAVIFGYQLLSAFAGTPIFILLLVVIVILDFVVIDMLDARIESYESDKIWARFNQQERDGLTSA